MIVNFIRYYLKIPQNTELFNKKFGGDLSKVNRWSIEFGGLRTKITN